jgi:hypothetical protein
VQGVVETRMRASCVHHACIMRASCVHHACKGHACKAVCMVPTAPPTPHNTRHSRTRACAHARAATHSAPACL